MKLIYGYAKQKKFTHHTSNPFNFNFLTANLKTNMIINPNSSNLNLYQP